MPHMPHMPPAGFVLVYRNQWQTVWIVTWIALFFFVAVGGVYNALPARWVVAFESKVGDTWNRVFRRGKHVNKISTTPSARSTDSGSEPALAKAVSVRPPSPERKNGW